MIRHPAVTVKGVLFLALVALANASIPSFPPHLVGTAAAVYRLLERVLPGSSAHFELALTPQQTPNAFTISDAEGGKTRITGTTASELTGGLGVYLREHCGMTVGWQRGGGSRIFTPEAWPKVGSPVTRARSVPYSHVGQVCTHSYTLVWHDWSEWEVFIDWMALAGHNSIVAPKGQEEIQYRVLTQHFGLSDMEVRNWTNGPAWLTWSRGQNSHGNGIGGPLPRSYMKSQWALQKQILSRYRELGIAGHLPSFGGYAPWALAVSQNATHRIARGKGAASDTAWVDGRDEVYTAVADRWMTEIMTDFGSDHVWQMDAFFSNGSGWGLDTPAPQFLADDASVSKQPACAWSNAIPNTYLAGYVHGHSVSFKTLAAAKAACLLPSNIETCGGVVSRMNGASFEIRGGMKPIAVPAADREASYVLQNRAQCLHPKCETYKTKASCPAAPRCTWTPAGGCVVPPPPPPPDTSVWRNRSAAAYGAVVKADGPDARWIYQGYALGIGSGGLGPASDVNAITRVHSFTSPVPEGQFILLDMSAHGDGEWHQWKGQWRVPFIWTALHTYGGNLGIKGNISKINAIPFEAPPLAPVPTGYDARTQAVGVGYEASFKAAPEPNITDWLIRRAHRRYGLPYVPRNADVAAAWAALGASGYAIDKGVNDGTGVCQMDILSKLNLASGFWNKADGKISSPAEPLCLEFASWGSLNAAAPAVKAVAEHVDVLGQKSSIPQTFSYDLVNTAREVLAQLSIPMLLNFSAAFSASTLSAAKINATADQFVQLLTDMESLLATDTAFMLGPWLASARKLGGNASDCTDTQIKGDIGNCANFMEWNAKAQLTTWYPVIGSAAAPQVQQGGRDHDYARKQWSGLLADVHIPRARLFQRQALQNAAAGQPFNDTAAKAGYALQSFKWQTDFGNHYPTEPKGDAVAISAALRKKYARFFSSC